MDDSKASSPHLRRQPRLALHPNDQPASFSFVCLGVGGGPLENDCSCYLMKPADSPWQDGSIVIEGGSWLGALTTVLQQTGPDSAFYDFDFPSSTSSSFLRAGLMASFAQCFLISHAHLDHILGLVLGSASLPGKRAVYGLKPTLENILDMFNGKIWPKLASWNEDEPYTMYHMRTIDHKIPYSLSDSLSVLPFALSHGLNPSEPPAPPTPTYSPRPLPQGYFSKRNSLPLSTQMTFFQLARSFDERARVAEKFLASGLSTHVDGRDSSSSDVRRPSFNSPFHKQDGETLVDAAAKKASDPVSPRASAKRTIFEATPALSGTDSGSSTVSSGAMSPTSPLVTGRPASTTRSKPRRPRTAQGSEKFNPPPSAWSSSNFPNAEQGALSPSLVSSSSSSPPPPSPPPTTSATATSTSTNPASADASAPSPDSSKSAPRRVSVDQTPPSLDSTAFFITHKQHDRDVLFFGDVEPDCVSNSPRNRLVWSHAAEKFVAGKLSAVFLECSFAKHHPKEFLYGHLSVEFLYDELRVLAIMVKRQREKQRRSFGDSNSLSSSGLRLNGARIPPSPLGTCSMSVDQQDEAIPFRIRDIDDQEIRGQLQGLNVIVIHVKPALFPTFSCDDSEQEIVEEVQDLTSSHRSSTKIDLRSVPLRIQDELNQEESIAKLGVKFVIAQQGMRIEC